MKTVIVTRPSPDGDRTCAALENIGASAIHAPVMRFELRPNVPAPPSSYSALAFTSANGVRAYQAQSWFTALPAYCVGEASAKAAQDAGLPIAGIGQSDVASLAELIAALPPAGPLLHVRGTQAAGDLIGLLAPRGVAASPSILYAMPAADDLPAAAVTALKSAKTSVAFFSPRTIAHFAELVGQLSEPVNLQCHTALCLSPAVANAASALPFGKFHVSAHPNEASFVDTVASLLT